MIVSRDAVPEIGGRLVRVLAAARPRFAGGALRLAMLLVAAYVYVWRQPSVSTAPTLWAEDGPIFLKGALEHGPGALFEPYQGQIFVFQRIIALLAAPLPVSIQPAIYAAVAVAAAVLSCSIVLSSRWRFSVPLSARFLCLLALLCSPAVNGEAFGTLTNAHWWLGIGLVLMGMLSDPLSRRLKLGELAFAALTALSGFAALYAVPSLAVRCFRNRSRHSLALLGVALSGILVQVGYLLNSGRHVNGAGMFEHPITEVIGLVRRVFAGSVLGDTNLAFLWPSRLPDTWVWLLPIALIVALTTIWIRAPRMEVTALLLALLGGWVLAMWAVTDPLTLLWLTGGRYFVVPMAILYVSLIVSWPAGTLRRGMAGLAFVLLATGILSDYHLNPLPHVDWTPFAACVEKHTTTCTTVIPPDWQLEINPPGR